ncbi:co-chaperone YbbN [Aeromicrobium sp. CTD01-1L150]|uniref:co-chaperone YbbN n=1 Tax=Aeromicrobium sp. CTD01-1L150 TaxID=3341830 RepID=UPI0035C1C448
MNFSRPGAIDLSALAPSSTAPSSTTSAAGQSAGGAGASWVVDVTEQNFQSAALEASMEHLVVLSLWSPRAQQSADFNALLARVTNSYGGQIVLAQVDVDANAQIAQALQAQGVPMVVGLVKGQPVPLFQGTADEPEVRQYFDQLVALAAQNGLTGRAAPTGGPAPQEGEPEPEQDDPRFEAADEAFAAGDHATAVAEYEKLLAQNPADAEVAERLAGVKLMARTAGADLQQARQAAADHPEDVAAQLLVADLDVSGGHVEDAFVRLIDVVKRTTGDEREEVRQRLLDLFIVVGTTDPRVADARRALAAALF